MAYFYLFLCDVTLIIQFNNNIFVVIPSYEIIFIVFVSGYFIHLSHSSSMWQIEGYSSPIVCLYSINFNTDWGSLLGTNNSTSA